MTFKALVVTETADGRFVRSIGKKSLDDLPAGDILVKVQYSSLNYKDALSATGNKGITRKYPHTPGIDAAGVVELSRSEFFSAGDEVIVTGYDLGMNTSGGYGGFIRVPAGWVVSKPSNYTLKECMVIGTAGFTAATALYKMELMGQSPGEGPIVVTGATGGVGSLAVSILSNAGYEVIAITGKSEANEYLKHLGASRIEGRDFVNDNSGKALIKPKWAGAIDTVGGNILSTLLKACKLEGNIVSTGLVLSPKLDTTVYPFILNGVSLLGVGSAEMSMQTKLHIWEKLGEQWNVKEKLTAICKEVTLEDLNETYFDEILGGKIMGRVIVDIE